MGNKCVKLLLAILMLVWFAPSAAHAAFEWPVSEWNIPFMGTMKTPMGFSAVEVKEFRNLMEQEKRKSKDPVLNKPQTQTGGTAKPPFPEGAPAILSETFPANPDAAAQRLAKSDFAFYHLSMDDGQAVHLAWLLAVRDGDPLPASVDVFSRELSPEQSLKLDELNKWLEDNARKAQYTDEKSRVSVRLLQMMPLQALPFRDGNLWTAGGRVMVTADEMPFAFFARIYAMKIDNRLAMVILSGFDGERPFWDPVIRDILLGLRESGGEK